MKAIQELKSRPLAFLERRARFRDGRLHVLLDDGTTAVEHPVSLQAGHAYAERVGIPVPDAVKMRTGLDLALAEVRVLLPPPGRDGDEVYWSYLPTERPSGHGVHVHADFYLQSSRRDVAFVHIEGDAVPAGPNEWNGWLLRVAAGLIVEQLWSDPSVLAREDFWRLAAPNAASCEHLRLDVAVRLLSTPGRFRQLVSEAFAQPPARGWTVRRYRDFFNAVEAWSTFAYNHYHRPDGIALHSIARQRQLDWRNHLLEETRASLAPVVPIVEQPGEDVDRIVAHAEALPGKGGRRIYLRKTEGFALPLALRNQGTQVTTFAPMPGRDLKEVGLLEFERPEVLAHVEPGLDDGEHADLLAAVCRLATEQPNLGGVGSLVSRGPGLDNPKPYWRFLANVGPMSSAARALARLKVPVVGGSWATACTVVLDSKWPDAPVLDAERFAKIATAAWMTDLPFELTTAAALFGIGPVPLGPDGAPSLSIPITGGGQALLHRWEWALGALLNDFPDLRALLADTPWIDEQISPEALNGNLVLGELGAFPIRPADLWWQDPRRGFRTKLLPVIERQQCAAPWMADLGISQVGAGSPRRTIGALQALRARPELLVSRLGEVELVYTALARELPDEQGGPHIPVLVRRIAKDGRAREMAWRMDGEEVWFDNGKSSHALAAFGGYALWVVRRDAARLAAAIGLQGFEPGVPACQTEGEENPALRDAFLAAIWRALPDLFAAAAHATIQPKFDGESALLAAALLRARHAGRVWLEYDFAGRKGTLGKDDSDDVFLIPGDEETSPWLVFDGDRFQLSAAAGALSELLCANSRAYVHVFTSGLSAWSSATDQADPPAVRRFRREHGLADAEVAGWRERLAATRMDPAQRAAWRDEVSKRLGQFGSVDPSRIDVDRPITPASWVSIADTEVNEEKVESLLKDLIPPPQVYFSPANKRAFQSVNPAPYMAQAAEIQTKLGWTEALYDTLRAKADHSEPLPEEPAFQVLGCDVHALWRTRFGLTLGLPAPSVAALAFAHGQIPLASLPDSESTTGTLLPWASGAATIGLAPLHDDEWLQKARRQATGGARAEDAVLVKALESADAWFNDEPDSFAAALRAAWDETYKEVRVKEAVEAAISSGKLKPALHAAGLVGDAGYDLLVPDRTIGRFLKVEVKRVENLDNAAFFLSENERRQALAVGAAWRLWLVAGDGRSRDVTWVRDSLEKAEPPVGEVLALGLRPGEWLVRVA